MAKPGLIAAAPAQLHLGHAGGGSRVWRTRIRQSQAFPDAARPRHADGVARSAPVIRRPAQRNLRHLEMIVKMTYVVRQMVDRLGTWLASKPRPIGIHLSALDGLDFVWTSGR